MMGRDQGSFEKMMYYEKSNNSRTLMSTPSNQISITIKKDYEESKTCVRKVSKLIIVYLP